MSDAYEQHRLRLLEMGPSTFSELECRTIVGLVFGVYARRVRVRYPTPGNVAFIVSRGPFHFTRAEIVELTDECRHLLPVWFAVSVEVTK